VRKRLTLLFACAFIVLAMASFSNTTTGRLLTVVVQGKTRCPFGETMRSEATTRAIIAAADRIRGASRMIREEGGLQLWETPHGRFWMPPASARMEPMVLGEMENEIYGKDRYAVRHGDVVLDCGADIGTFTRTALRRGASVVVAIEPNPQKEPCLRRNFEKEIADGRVIVYPKGVWNEDSVLELNDEVFFGPNGSGVKVPLTTIDKLVAELKLPKVDFIKMDIEGAEKQALAGARETLARFHPRMSIAMEHLPDDWVAIPRTVRGIAGTYRSQCGPCEWAHGQIQPHTMYFY
jgi:FkbM family methyltransferase